MRSPGCGTSRTLASREPRARVADHDVAPREDHGLADGGRAASRPREIELGQRAGRARRRVRAEHRETVGALHQLHRRGPARVHFDRVRNAVARDEVDAVDADEAELLGHRAGERARRVHERRVARERVASRREDVPAVPVSRRSEGAVADQLARHAERHRAPAGRDEHDRAGRSLHELLQVAAARQTRRAELPGPHAVPAARSQAA